MEKINNQKGNQMKQVKIIQDEKEPVAVEVLAASIKAIATGIKTLRKGPLGESALLLLIQDNCYSSKGHRKRKVKLSISVIKSVLNSLESLQREYLK